MVVVGKVTETSDRSGEDWKNVAWMLKRRDQNCETWWTPGSVAWRISPAAAV